MRLTLVIAVLFACCFFNAVCAQQDSLKSYRKFLSVCNSYKTLPMELRVQILKQTNFITDSEDTMSVAAAFQLTSEGTNITMGELEQITNDSLMLFVNNAVRRMIVYKHGSSPEAQLKQMLGISFSDSSLRHLAKTYSVHDSGNVVQLQSRSKLAGTFAKEVIRVQFSHSNQPEDVTYTTHSILPLDSTEVIYLKDQPAYAKWIFQTEEGSSYFVKEHVTIYKYQSIIHAAGRRLNSVGERIQYTNGRYVPAKGYEDFLVDQGF